jgi:hypothetical protein
VKLELTISLIYLIVVVVAIVNAWAQELPQKEIIAKMCSNFNIDEIENGLNAMKQITNIKINAKAEAISDNCGYFSSYFNGNLTLKELKNLVEMNTEYYNNIK